MNRARVAAWIGAVVLLGLALLGGEYNVRDWLILRSELAGEQAALERLQREIDSLTALVRELETNPAAQERAAREQFGMIREGEILYRLVPPR